MALKPASITWPAAGAGLFGGGLALALHQQASFAIASWACETKPISLLWAGVGALLLLLVSTALSWLALRRIVGTGVEAEARDALRSRRFLATISLFGVALFLFALALQAAAILFLPECQG